MSAISSRSRRKSTKDDRTLLYIVVAFAVLVLVLIAALSWLGNGNRVAVAPSALADADLLPLAEPVNPMYGFHDMANMPNLHPATRTVPATAPQPNLDAPLARWDWGTIPARPPVSQNFPIQNLGDQPLVITKIVTSCGCTIAHLSSSFIPPGQRADLLVTFDPAFHLTTGPVSRVVWLETNDPDTPLLELRLEANVLP
jgi:hypothetical protein